MNSSITTASPAPPKPPSNIVVERRLAPPLAVSAMITPLPAARPSALITTGRPKSSSAASAASRSEARA